MPILVYIYCFICYHFWTACYNMLEAIAFFLWHGIMFIERRLAKLAEIVEDYYD